MDKKRIKELFDKHFEKVGESFKNKIVDNKEATFDIFYHPPLSNRNVLYGSIFNTCNIRYGDFLEEIINDFLEENGAIVSKTEKKKGNYDLLFEFNNVIYVGEIKIRDNHDSTKKKGQIENLIKKALAQKEKNKDKKVIALVYFIDHYQRKNGEYYKKELCINVESKMFDDSKVFYGDEIFKEFNLYDKWIFLKNEIINFNKISRDKNYIKSIIISYLKEYKKKNNEKNYEEISKILELFDEE